MAVAQRVAEEVLATCQHNTLLALRRWVLPATPIRSSRKLECLFIARMRGLGCMGPVGQRHRKQDLIAAVVRAGERAATTPIASRWARKEICSSAGVFEQLGLCTEAYSDSDGPGSAAEPPSCTALVALDSAAAPLKLQQKLSRRWRKKWAKLFKRKIFEAHRG